LVDLDDLTIYPKLDPLDMLRRIKELPWQCQEAWEDVQSLALPPEYSWVANVVILGMGGSAIGGDLARSLTILESRAPIMLCRDYDVPGFVDEHTLVIASSYSGDTEETLSAFQQARERKAKLLALTTGGKLRQLAENTGIPLYLFSYKSQPRAALGHSLVPLIGIFQKLGLVSDKSADLLESIKVMGELQSEISEGVPLEKNLAKQLASAFYNHLPVIYGSGILSEVARRWRGQVSENAKAWAFFELLPELNHNAIAGYEFPPQLGKEIVVVLLTCSHDHPRTKVRFGVTEKLLWRSGVRSVRVQARGLSPLAQMFYTVHLGDFVSYYLALLYRADPTSIPAIEYLKGELAKAEMPGSG
jgi:glucose/mannose-6-phosphate isomerase